MVLFQPDRLPSQVPTMSLEVQEVTASDFDSLKVYPEKTNEDLVAPIAQISWPAETPESQQSRNEWSINQQRVMFEQDPSVKFLKVTDRNLPQDQNVVSLARWHFYQNGYPHPENTPWEMNGTDSDAEEKWPEGMNVKMHKAVLNPIFSERGNWAGKRPQWVLTTIATRPSHRKRGAGGLLVSWGVQKAKEDNVPAFLEAAEDAASLYKKCGFQEVGTLVVKGEDTGLGVDFKIAKMAANL